MNFGSKKVLNYLALFSSTSTLLCCALPSAFVLLGAGAAFASILEVAPFLITFSEHKVLLFSFAFSMLIISGILQHKAKGKSCPIDKKLADACKATRNWSKVIYVFSWICLITAFTVTFIVPKFI